jgi:CRISPR-associated endonuclease/helicase Cas3
VVFDEVHAYDDQLFGSLLRFLEALPGVPALLMTASLPKHRLGALRRLVARSRGSPLGEIDGPGDLESLPRYRCDPSADPWPAVEGCLKAGGKVLWVSNTVGDCLAVGEEAARRGHTALTYHSRFRYRDRVKCHGQVIDAFRASGPALAATTQVCEMSLDLSADLLITSLAPVPAMIQRLGRLNRRSTPDRPLPVRAFVVLPFAGLPYDNAELAAARAWLARLTSRDLSQRDLISAWDQVDARVAAVPSAWLDGLFLTEPASCREAGPGIDIILELDAAAVASGHLAAEEAVIPMTPPPRRLGDWQRWRKVRHRYVPPGETVVYDPMRGAQWAKP